MKNKTCLLTAGMLALLLVSCSRPPKEHSSNQTPSSVPTQASPSGQAGPAAPAGDAASGAEKITPAGPTINEDLQLADAVSKILARAHRSGSVIEGGACNSARQISSAHMVQASLKLEPMKEALAELCGHYPGISCSDTGTQVRVVDSSAAAGLLRVRVKEFLVIEDQPPQVALSALWRRPEIAAYMARRRIRFARTSGRMTSTNRHAPTVVHMKNATVQEILDRIISSHASQRMWVYRECKSAKQTLVEVSIR